jgi:hypothetical protein
MTPRYFAGFAAVVIGFGLCSAAFAQSTAELGQSSGPDRMERLIAGAQAEGELSFYTSLPVLTTTQITEAFEEK